MTDNKRVTNKQILQKIDDLKVGEEGLNTLAPVSYTYLRAHETVPELVCRLLLEIK